MLVSMNTGSDTRMGDSPKQEWVTPTLATLTVDRTAGGPSPKNSENDNFFEPS